VHLDKKYHRIFLSIVVIFFLIVTRTVYYLTSAVCLLVKSIKNLESDYFLATKTGETLTPKKKAKVSLLLQLY
jgi:hypothetical protein